MLSFNAAYERFTPPCSKRSYRWVRISRMPLYEWLGIARIELLVLLGSGVPLGRIRGTHSDECVVAIRAGGYPALRWEAGHPGSIMADTLPA